MWLTSYNLWFLATDEKKRDTVAVFSKFTAKMKHKARFKRQE